MHADQLAQIQEVFLAALDRPAEERAAFLDTACGRDTEVREAVERYLRADAAADGDAFLDASVAAGALGESLEEEVLRGDAIGPYSVLRPLGRGGMGNVYLAVREKPFRRYVALKLIRRDASTSNSLARFAVERQILASLDHPRIARLFDGGMTDTGQSYFAMEYVEGEPLTAYCNERQLSVEDRLRLFVQICEAVHYAHQNLVLHRDLKPSNILVTERAGSTPEVKLLDFGIAKLLNPQLSPVPQAVTREAQLLMTPEYASPEQFRGEQLTTTSDVYGLGVLLYELLTGRRPHDLDGLPMHEMAAIVSQEPPTRPSSVATTVEERAEAVQVRGLTTPQLRRRLRGDLDAICLKALRQEPGKRYGSAELLAQDIERYLTREPVVARRGTRRYRAVSFLRRHRVGAAVTAASVVALAVGLGFAVWQGRIAAAERDRAEETSAFMIQLLGDLDPNQAENGQLDLADLLGRAVAQVESGLEAQPNVQAELYTHLGDLYVTITQATAAEALYERALGLRRDLHGEVHEKVVESLNDVAWARWAHNAYHEADSLYTLSLGVQRQLPRLSPLTRATTLNGLAYAHRGLGEFEEALRLAREAYMLREEHLGPDDPLTVKALSDVGSMNYSLGRYDEAEGIFADVVTRRQAGIGTPLDLADALTSYGAVLTAREDYDGAFGAHEQALAIRRRVLGATHPKVAESLSHIGWGFQTQRRFAEAETYYREALALRQGDLGARRIPLANSLLVLGEVLGEQGKAEEGPRMTAQAAETYRSILGSQHRTTLFVELRHAKNFLRVGRNADAYAHLERVLPSIYEVIGPGHARTREAEALFDSLRAIP